MYNTHVCNAHDMFYDCYNTLEYDVTCTRYCIVEFFIIYVITYVSIYMLTVLLRTACLCLFIVIYISGIWFILSFCYNLAIVVYSTSVCLLLVYVWLVVNLP